MYNNILVPVVIDHGKHPTDSLKVAEELLNENGQITLMTVLEEIPSYASTYLPDDLAQQHHKRVTDDLNLVCKDVNASVKAVVDLLSRSPLQGRGQRCGCSCWQ